jgi:two-component system, chemotaxis family, CheB/CheR fusion protein
MDAKEEEALPQLVVFGSSAGGIDALGSVLEGISPNFGAPILIAQHLDPRRPSHLAEILGRLSKLPIHGVEQPTELRPGNAYILPADHPMAIAVGRIEVGEEDGDRPTPSIDRILASAAGAYGEGLTAVILSGSGSDGAVGARHVKAAGGTVVIQNPETAPYPSMPQAIASSLVDIVADAEAIGPLIEELVGTPRVARRGDDEKRLLRSFLDDLRDRSGIDFGSYKRGTIMRRLQRRMLATGTSDLRQYVTYVQQHPEEYQRLTSSFLIKVTEFFRDSDLFDYLRDEILPKLIEDARTRDGELRLWSAGCATGEEAYSLAILVAEALGDELGEFNVRIFATDVDLDAISFARRGTYPAATLASVPEEIRDRYFTRVGDLFEVKKQIRALTVFGQHDLGQRAPFPRVDLALCRNVLIYFTNELQKRALQLFAFALRDGGYLALGKAESTSPLSEHFVLTHPRLKVYRRQGDRVLIPPARIRDSSPIVPLRLPIARRPGWSDVGTTPREVIKASSIVERSDQLLLRLPVSVVVIDRDYDVQLINAAARRTLGIHGQAIGEDLIHLLDSAIGRRVKALIDRAFRGQDPGPEVVEISAPAAEGAETHFVELTALVLSGDTERGTHERVLLAGIDVTSTVVARRSLEQTIGAERDERERASEHARQLAEANASLLDANQELTTANAELRSANEELLVANEEVQAATEEVETLNEELQATNEELETLNEELQATVEELNTTNDDLEARTVELQESAIAVEHQRALVDSERVRLLALIDAIDEPILVVDRDGAVIKANRPFRDLIGDPEKINLSDGSGKEIDGERSPSLRAAREAFEADVTAGRKRYRVLGRPLEGIDGGFGALIFRPSSK